MSPARPHPAGLGTLWAALEASSLPTSRGVGQPEVETAVVGLKAAPRLLSPAGFRMPANPDPRRSGAPSPPGPTQARGGP